MRHFIQWEPKNEDIDLLKEEGNWNNDWDASRELIKRRSQLKSLTGSLPEREEVIEIFSDFYFGANNARDSKEWTGFINNEPLMVDNFFFRELTREKIAWGFLSGAEPQSAKFVLEERLGLINPPLIAMGEAPEKPNPMGLLKLSKLLLGGRLGENMPLIIFVGDTIADVLTVINAKKEEPSQRFLSFALAPPHLQKQENELSRIRYEDSLRKAGADIILKETSKTLIEAKSFMN